MTEQQLEAAARHLCALRGVNPDGMMVAQASRDLVHRTWPAWRQAALEIQQHLQVQEAIAAGLRSAP